MSFMKPKICDDAQTVLDGTNSYFFLIQGSEESTQGVTENNLVFSKYGLGLAAIYLANRQIISQIPVTVIQALQLYDRQYPEKPSDDLEQKLTQAMKLCFS